MRSFFLSTAMILCAVTAQAETFGELSCRDLTAWKGGSAFVVSWIHGVNERVAGVPVFKDLHDDFAFKALNREAAEIEKLCAASPDTHLYRVVDILYPDLSGVDIATLPE